MHSCPCSCPLSYLGSFIYPPGGSQATETLGCRGPWQHIHLVLELKLERPSAHALPLALLLVINILVPMVHASFISQGAKTQARKRLWLPGPTQKILEKTSGFFTQV